MDIYFFPSAIGGYIRLTNAIDFCRMQAMEVAMKKYLLLLALVFLTGCAHNQMQFRLAQGTTQDDYSRAKIECGDTSSGGYFLFGPLFILAPVIAVIESVKFAKRHGLQDCLEEKGFQCIENCAHETPIKP